MANFLLTFFKLQYFNQLTTKTMKTDYEHLGEVNALFETIKTMLLT